MRSVLFVLASAVQAGADARRAAEAIRKLFAMLLGRTHTAEAA